MAVRDKKGKWIWKLAPAYDLTLSTEGYNGEHATSVNGTGRPKLADFIAIDEKIRISKDRCQLIEQVSENCHPIIRYKI